MNILSHIPALVGTALGVFTLVSVVVAWLRARKKKAASTAALEEGAEVAAVEDPAARERAAAERKVLAQRRARLPKLFSTELSRLRKNSSGSDYRYRVPWCLAIGPTNSGQSTVLRSTGLHSPFGSEDDTASREAGCRWNFFDKGIALDVDGLSVWDEETFSAVLKLLRRERPKRPLDSLLLCIPATDLLGQSGQPTDEELRRRAEVIYERVQQLQKTLSIRVPIYVLITKCDQVPGFVAFCGALPQGHREQLFGWSSPHAPEDPYNTGWVDEAFDAIYRTQCLTQIELLSQEGISAVERESAFLFPQHLRALSEPLRILLDQLFKSTVYAESTTLRGIYFCGDASKPGGNVGLDDAPHSPSFLNHLFSRKIFPELGLAQPLQQSILASNQAVTVMKVLTGAVALAGLITLYVAREGLARDVRTVANFLDLVLNDTGSDRATPDRQRAARRAQSLLSAMAEVTTSHLKRVRLPTSYFSDIDEEVRSEMGEAFQDAVLSGLHSGLEQKAKQTLGIDPDAPFQARPDPTPKVEDESNGGGGAADPKANEAKGGAPAPKIVSFPNSQEYQDLRGLAAAYAEFSRFVDLYNALSTDKHKRMETVAPLVKYVLQTELGEGFTKNSALYEEALAAATYQPYDMQKVVPRVRERAKYITRQLHRKLFLENPVDLDSDEVARQATRLKSVSEWGGTDLPTLTRLRDVLQRLERTLERPELVWLTKEALDLGEPYRDLLAGLRPFTASGQTPLNDEIQTEWKESFRQLKRKIMAYQASVLGPVLLKDNEKGRLIVAAPLTTLRNSLDGFLSQNYVQMGGDRVPLQSPEGAFRVSWNEENLRQASALSDAYTVFVRDRLGQFPDAYRELVKATARERLGSSMPSLVAAARKTERLSRATGDLKTLLEEVTTEVGDLRRASPLLRQVLETYERLELKAPRGELYGQLESDAKETLRRLDTLQEKDEMYKVSSKLKNWRGLRPPAYDAFDSDDAEGLTQYLKAQRNRMKYWAKDFAKTPVSLLEGITPGGSASESDPTVLKWKKIVAELDAFEKMTPDNSVKQLESFIEVTMVALTPDNCLDRLPRRSGETPDFFLQSKARIYDEMRRRCVQFNEERLLDGYERLARRFNKDLGGRFPFSRTAISGDDEEADPRDVRTFLQEFDEYATKFAAYASRNEVNLSPIYINSNRDINNYIETIKGLRPFFAPLLSDKSGDTAPRYSLNVAFRINTQNEINGSQIAEYALAVADQRIEDAVATWQLGDRIRVSFRFAKDGLYRPAENGQARGAITERGDTVTYEWGGRWGLLRFLRNYKTSANDMRRSLDKTPHILKFVMEIEEKKRNSRLRLLPENYYNAKGVTTNQQRSAYIFNKAIVYARFALSLPESKDPLVLPEEWPANAPPLRGYEYK